MKASPSIVIPALNAAATMGRTLDGLRRERAGEVGEIIVVDGGSDDETVAIAEALGARVVPAPSGRGHQLARGAEAAAGEWLLFLHADTLPERGWADALAAFAAEPDNAERAAVFRFALDDPSPAARRLERVVAWRTRALALPYGDQGLFLSRAFYDALGGFRPLPLFEDVDLIRRIGRRRLEMLNVRAVTSSARYRGPGYVARSARNLGCLGLYFLGVKPALIAKLYGR